MKISFNVKYPLILLEFSQTWVFLTSLQIIRKYQIIWKTVQCEAICFMRASRETDGQTDIMIIRAEFCNFP
jgi:hypothetical protein